MPRRVTVVECRIPDVLALAVVELRHAGPLLLLGSLVDWPKHGVVADQACTDLVVVDVAAVRVVRHKVLVKLWRERLEALEHSLTPRLNVVRPLVDVPQLGGQREAERHVAALEALAEARVDLEVLLVEDVARKRLLRKGARDRLGLYDPPPHRRRGNDGRLEASRLACQKVRQALDVAGPAAGRLVGRSPRLEGGGQDLVIEEEHVVLEGDAAAEAHVARHEERELLEVVLCVEAADAAADLLRSLARTAQCDDRRCDALTRGDADLLEEAVENDDCRTHGHRVGRDGLVAATHDLARCEGADAGRQVAVRRRLDCHLQEVECRHLLLVLEVDDVVLDAEVDRQRRLLERHDADRLELLDEGVDRRSHHDDLLDKVLLHDVLEVRVTPEADRGVGLVDPDVELDGRAETLEDGLDLLDDLCEVVKPLAIRTAHDHANAVGRDDLAHEVVDGDLRAVAAIPAEAVALDLRVGLALVVKERHVHADGRLLYEAAVVGLDQKVDVLARLGRLLFLDHVLDATRLAALAVEREHLALRVSGTHCVGLPNASAGLNLAGGFVFNFY